MYYSALYEMLAQINTQEILAEAEHNRLVRQARARHRSHWIVLSNWLRANAFRTDRPDRRIMSAAAGVPRPLRFRSRIAQALRVIL